MLKFLRKTFLILFVLLGAASVQAERFADDVFGYRLDVPEGAIVNHYPGENFNLTITLPDSTARITVYALDVDSVPRDQFASSDDMVFKKKFLRELDRMAFNVGDSCLSDQERFWTNVKERRYALPDGREAITNVYMDEKHPYVVAAFGKDLDRPEITQTLDSFQTRHMPYSGWSMWACMGAAILLAWLGFVMGDSSNGFIKVVGVVLTVICIIAFLALIVEFEVPYLQKFFYWLT